MSDVLQAPFPYFGGKAMIAARVWSALGDVAHYVEPFCGSAAVLLARPTMPRIETINDADGFVANFWRAVKHAPDAVAEHADWPVNEVDLEARHRWLCRQPEKGEFLERMKHDADYFDAQRAGWWCWGLAAWIGSGWCDGEYYGPDHAENRGRGVCNEANKLPSLGWQKGIHRQLPHLGNAGRGIHRQLPHLGDAGIGECARRREVIVAWISALADRLRNVRVCCGDWARVVTRGALAHGSTLGIFLDPPYSHAVGRDEAIYRVESADVAVGVSAWCAEHGADTRYRIVLAGYEGEHNDLERLGWRVEHWKAHGGLGNLAKGDARGKANAHRERLWYSPHCLAGTLFGAPNE